MLKAVTKCFLLSLLLAVAFIEAVQAQEKALDDVIVVNTDLVVLRVTVTDKKGSNVTGLKKENFKIYEDGVEQTASFFSAEESSVSWGLVLDRSGSMAGMMEDVYKASLHVIDEGTKDDEMFIVTFNDKTELVSRFISDRHRLENSTLGLRAEGSTALYDAISFALDEMKKSKFPKKVLVVVTDGEDNASRLTFHKLIERAEEEEVIIYAVGMFESYGMMSFGGGSTRKELKKLAEVTGGAAHFPSDTEGCRKVMKEIAREVSQQYSLGYYPSNKNYDERWRSIRVKAETEESRNNYITRTRTGYYARKRDRSHLKTKKVGKFANENSD